MQHLRSAFSHEGIHGLPLLIYKTELKDCHSHGATFVDFISFPRDHGWTITETYKLQEAVSSGSCQKLEGYPFLQGWIYFQLVRSFFNIGDNSIPAPSLVDEGHNDHQPVLTTDRLDGYLHDWQEAIKSLFADNRPEAVTRLVEANQMIEMGRRVLVANVAENDEGLLKLLKLRTATSHSNHRSTESSSRSYCFKRAPSLQESELALGLMVLGETLSAALTKVMKDLKLSLSGWMNDDDSGWGPSNYVNAKMGHWCPRAKAVLRGKLGRNATLLYATLRTHQDNKHMVHADKECSETHCSFIEAAARSSDHQSASIYTPAHTHDNCECHFVGPIEERVIHILSSEPNVNEARDFPLLYVEGTGENLAVGVKKWEEGDKFATISHVWSQGLGNKCSNKIHACQLAQIQDYLTKVLVSTSSGQCSGGTSVDPASESKRLYFWLDTLAIPQSTTKATSTQGLTREQLKKRAIDRINDVFNKATCCIVIDQHLLKTGRTTNDARTNGIALLSSAWMMRLWTLQEAFVSTECKLVMENGDNLVAMGGLRKTNNHGAMIDSINEVIWGKLGESLMNKNWVRSNQDQGLRIANAWKATRYRTIQHVDDETQVLASLLDIPIPEEYNYPGLPRCETLMHDFWLKVQAHEILRERIPAGIIFSPGRRLSIPGYGWAPRTWMCHEDETYPYPLQQAHFALGVQNEGLVVRYPGFILHPSRSKLRRILSSPSHHPFEFSVSRELSEWYQVRKVQYKQEPQQMGKRMNLDTNRIQEDLLIRLREGTDLRLAILLSRPRPVETPAEIGLLVEVINSPDSRSPAQDDVTNDMTLCCRLICRVEISRYNLVPTEQHPLLERFSKFGEDKILGVAVESGQKWCIDGYGVMNTTDLSKTEAGPPTEMSDQASDGGATLGDTMSAVKELFGKYVARRFTR